MKLVGIMPVHSEDWVVGLSIRVALMWTDAMVILDHASADGTAEILADLQQEFPGRVTVLRDSGANWDEMAHRQKLLEMARSEGATHIAIVDADEILTGNLLGPFHAMTGVSPGNIITLPGYNLRGGIGRYHANGIWGNRWFSTAFADDERLYWGGDNFHHREPLVKYGPELKQYRPISQGEGGIMHLWGASERRLKAKSAHYKLTERLRWPEKPVADIERMYNWAIHGEPGHRSFGTPDTWTYADVPASWWAPYQQWMEYLDIDAEPWQEADIRRLLEKHGSGLATGLDLFGVV